MKSFARISSRLPRSSNRLLPVVNHLHAAPLRITTRHTMSTTQAPAQASQPVANQALSFASIGVKNTNINTAEGVNLNPQQQLAVGSVLDLFEGRPSLKHLSLWSRTAIFQDPIALAQGYDQFAAQWYGLPALFNPIALQSHRVIDGGNPISLEVSNKYVVKGIGKEQTISSIVRIWLGEDGKIEKVEDRWNNKLPEGGISETFRKLNAKTVPNFVKVPKTEEEDQKMMANRGNN